ncbi:hypothetical protein LA080_008065 [Diaporthe eres]|nr:hypothetical protein LA080_008065 [Diaporthe eres]
MLSSILSCLEQIVISVLSDFGPGICAPNMLEAGLNKVLQEVADKRAELACVEAEAIEDTHRKDKANHAIGEELLATQDLSAYVIDNESLLDQLHASKSGFASHDHPSIEDAMTLTLPSARDEILVGHSDRERVAECVGAISASTRRKATYNALGRDVQSGAFNYTKLIYLSRNCFGIPIPKSGSLLFHLRLLGSWHIHDGLKLLAQTTPHCFRKSTCINVTKSSCSFASRVSAISVLPLAIPSAMILTLSESWEGNSESNLRQGREAANMNPTSTQIHVRQIAQQVHLTVARFWLMRNYGTQCASSGFLRARANPRVSAVLAPTILAGIGGN